MIFQGELSRLWPEEYFVVVLTRPKVKHLLLILGVLWVVLVEQSSLFAAVAGQVYDVQVERLPFGSFEDRFRFEPGGIFVSRRGGLGSWRELDLVIFSLWTCSYGDGVTFTTFSGIEYRDTLSGVGSNNSGSVFLLNGNSTADLVPE